MFEQDVLMRIADRYSPDDILHILGLTHKFESDEIEEMTSTHLIGVYHKRILSNLGDFDESI